MSESTFMTLLFSVFAGLALLLGAVGIYGVTNVIVSQRTHEIGIRMTLGAPQRTVLLSVLTQGMKPVALGVVMGILGAFVTTRILAGFLFGVTATDPAAFSIVVVSLFLVALAAAYFPAKKASQVDPMVAIRNE